ncbi:MAG: glutamate-1-semialdehyde 2,1-aminomutase [bacterium]|nr:glutamate-1-semialdehyde 2,1-aminomutase [bacterium]
MEKRSKELFEKAKDYIPGGVNSPVRAFKAVGRDPIFIKRGKGSHIYDVSDREYIDYVCSWGPLILGHARQEVVSAIKEVVEQGTSFGAPTENEITLAEMIVNAVPSIELVRLVNSGTEATMSAIRLARGYTRRDKIIKFEGCYHGHSDSLLVKAGSGATTLGVPNSLGVPLDFVRHTITLPYNDLECLRRTIEKNHREIACVIIEPVAGNMGVVPPKPGFLEGLREITRRYDIVLIFDEIITGFRVSYGGAQELYGVLPDLTCLGKIIGGGLPIGAYGGKREIMQYISPEGEVYQAGTLSGNPISVSAGITTLKLLSQSGIYEELEERSSALYEGLAKSAKEAKACIRFTRVGSMLCGFFTPKDVIDYVSAKSSDTEKYAAYFRGMLDKGIYLAPSQFETMFVSTAHSMDDIEQTIKASYETLKKIGG